MTPLHRAPAADELDALLERAATGEDAALRAGLRSMQVVAAPSATTRDGHLDALLAEVRAAAGRAHPAEDLSVPRLADVRRSRLPARAGRVAVVVAMKVSLVGVTAAAATTGGVIVTNNVPASFPNVFAEASAWLHGDTLPPAGDLLAEADDDADEATETIVAAVPAAAVRADEPVAGTPAVDTTATDEAPKAAPDAGSDATVEAPATDTASTPVSKPTSAAPAPAPTASPKPAPSEPTGTKDCDADTATKTCGTDDPADQVPSNPDKQEVGDEPAPAPSPSPSPEPSPSPSPSPGDGSSEPTPTRTERTSDGGVKG